MAKFRKKPVVIEAVQLRWENWSEMCEFADVGKLEEGKPTGVEKGADGEPLPNGLGLAIPTLEGLMVAQEDDWVIRGVKGELYPCKPDIFEATYEEVVAGNADVNIEIKRLEKRIEYLKAHRDAAGEEQEPIENYTDRHGT